MDNFTCALAAGGLIHLPMLCIPRITQQLVRSSPLRPFHLPLYKAGIQVAIGCPSLAESLVVVLLSRVQPRVLLLLAS